MGPSAVVAPQQFPLTPPKASTPPCSRPRAHYLIQVTRAYSGRRPRAACQCLSATNKRARRVAARRSASTSTTQFTCPSHLSHFVTPASSPNDQAPGNTSLPVADAAPLRRFGIRRAPSTAFVSVGGSARHPLRPQRLGLFPPLPLAHLSMGSRRDGRLRKDEIDPTTVRALTATSHRDASFLPNPGPLVIARR